MTTAPVSRAPRSEQGAERRSIILGAAVRLLIRDGLAAVTHRAVAAEAEVPLAATTYYFDSKDELLTEALAALVADEVERIAHCAEELGEGIRSPHRAAGALAAALFPDKHSAGALLAKLEIYLEAARRPGLRKPAARWREAFAELAESALVATDAPDPARRAPLLVAALDGILVHELSAGTGENLQVGNLRARLERLFELFLAGG